MIEESEVQTVEEKTPAGGRPSALVIVLSVAIAVVLAIGATGTLLGYRKAARLQAEALAVRQELKRKTEALDDMTARIEALSQQMRALREHAVASSQASPAPAEPAHTAIPDAVPAGPVLPPLPAQGTLKGPAKESREPESPPKPAPEKRLRPDPKESCDLVGKSPEEQAATLRRCVSAMEAAPELPRKPSSDRTPERRR